MGILDDLKNELGTKKGPEEPGFIKRKVSEATFVPQIFKLILELIIFLAIWFYTGFFDVALLVFSFSLITQHTGIFKAAGVGGLIVLQITKIVSFFIPRGTTALAVGLLITIALDFYMIIKYQKEKKLPADATLLMIIYLVIIIFIENVWPLIAGSVIAIFPTITRTLEISGTGSRSTFRALPDFAEYSQQQSAIWDTSSDEASVAPPSVAFQLKNMQITPSTGACFDATSFHATGILENIGETEIKDVAIGFKLSRGQDSGLANFTTGTNITKSFRGFYPCEGAIYQKGTTSNEIMKEWPVKGEGFLCDQTIPTLFEGQPRSIACTNMYIAKKVVDETKVTCYVDAFAKADYHTRALLPVQFIQQEYAILNPPVYSTPSPVTSIGGASLSIDAGTQPILDVDDSQIALTVGLINVGQGKINYVKDIYLWVPNEFGNCGGSHFSCGVDCSEWSLDKEDCNSMKSLGYNLCKVSLQSKDCNWQGVALGDVFKDEFDPCYFEPKKDRCDLNCNEALGWLDSSDNALKAEKLASWDSAIKAEDARIFCNELATAGAYDQCAISGLKTTTRYACTLNIPYPVTDETLRRTFLFRADTFYNYEYTTTATVSGEKCG